VDKNGTVDLAFNREQITMEENMLVQAAQVLQGSIKA